MWNSKYRTRLMQLKGANRAKNRAEHCLVWDHFNLDSPDGNAFHIHEIYFTSIWETVIRLERFVNIVSV